MKKWMALLLGLLISGAVLAQIKVVYHLSEGIPQASRAIGNIRNHLAADPTAKIVVVTHGLGIDFLIDGATNQLDQPFAGGVSDLPTKALSFVCATTRLFPARSPPINW